MPGEVDAFARELEQLRAVTYEHHWRLQMLEAQMRKRVLVSEARAALLEANRTAREPGCVSRSQYGEDAVIWELLGRPISGRFLEAGAIDGLTLSVTAILESLGWSGILIEPVPEQASACRRHRPASTVFETALGPPDAPPTVSFLSIEGAPEFSGLDPDREHRGLAADQGGRERRIEVPITTIDRVLEGSGTGETLPLDAVVLDLEGGEAEALRGFDLGRWRPRLVMIEDHDRTDGSPVARAMKESGYHLAGITRINRVYLHPDEHAAMERAASMIWM